MIDWKALFNEERRRPTTGKNYARTEGRTEIERDYDRILFSTAVRRMADKTQVFPLEQHDAIHTRLTHSHEVSALARGIGLDLAVRKSKSLGMPDTPMQMRDTTALMAAVGLVHDIGNPPFGHQGERAIQQWFARNEKTVFDKRAKVSKTLRKDFLKFDGNAQTFRLVTTLQVLGDKYGLNLTYATLAVLLKYTVPARAANDKHPLAGRHKPGFFKSEESIVQEVWQKTGLATSQRHPLAFLVEACDDIAYSVIDVEDTVKKDLASYEDVRAHLESVADRSVPADKVQVIAEVIESSRTRRSTFIEQNLGKAHSPAEIDDYSMQVFRVAAISAMVAAVLETFVTEFAKISSGSFEGDLIESSDASTLRNGLKTFLKRVAFPHRAVLEVELRGTQVIHELMDKLWKAIVDHDEPTHTDPTRNSLSAYTYSRISENYRRVFDDGDDSLPIRYRECQLLIDMVSGMTDSFAVTLLHELREFDPRTAL